MRVVQYSSDNFDVWNDFISNSRIPNFLFHRNYMEYHSSRFNDVSLMFYRGGKVRAVFAANSSGKIVISHQGLTYGGLITGVDVKCAELSDIFELLRLHFRNNGFLKIIYKKIPWCFAINPIAEDEYFLFKYGATLIRRDLSSVVDLNRRPKLSDLRLRLIKKSKNFELKVSLLIDLESFYSLLSDVLSKHDVTPVHSVDELNLLRSRFPNQIKFYGCWYGDELVSAVCLYDFGHIVHSQYIACSEFGRKIGALDYLLDFLLEKKTLEGKSFFSFGISTENEGRLLNAGLIAQKEGFGGRGVVHDFYELNLDD